MASAGSGKRQPGRPPLSPESKKKKRQEKNEKAKISRAIATLQLKQYETFCGKPEISPLFEAHRGTNEKGFMEGVKLHEEDRMNTYVAESPHGLDQTQLPQFNVPSSMTEVMPGMGSESLGVHCTKRQHESCYSKVQMSGMQDQMSGMLNQMSGMQVQLSGMQGQLSGMQGQLSGMQVMLNQVSGMLKQVSGMLEQLQQPVYNNDAQIQRSEVAALAGFGSCQQANAPIVSATELHHDLLGIKCATNAAAGSSAGPAIQSLPHNKEIQIKECKAFRENEEEFKEQLVKLEEDMKKEGYMDGLLNAADETEWLKNIWQDPPNFASNFEEESHSSTTWTSLWTTGATNSTATGESHRDSLEIRGTTAAGSSGGSTIQFSPRNDMN